jgi:hypothetical protein
MSIDKRLFKPLFLLPHIVSHTIIDFDQLEGYLFEIS